MIGASCSTRRPDSCPEGAFGQVDVRVDQHRRPTMLALRRTPRRLVTSLFIRGNATTTVPPSDTSLPPPPAEAKPTSKTVSSALNPQPKRDSSVEPEAEASSEEKKRPTRKYPTKRPRISLENPRQWSRPLGVGVLPVYDEALAYIKRDSALRKQELQEYREELVKAESAKPVKTAEVERLKEKVEILEIQSEINLPSVRWKARNGMGTRYIIYS